MLRPLAQHKGEPVQLQAGLARIGGDDDLAEPRHHLSCTRARKVGIDRYLSPAEHRYALLRRQGFELPASFVSVPFVRRQEGDPGRVGAERGEV